MTTGGEQKHVTRDRGLGTELIDPLVLYQHLLEAKKKFVIVIDEYDAIPSQNQDFHTSIAYLMKLLSDSLECDSRIVVVGVAQSAQELLGRHESIERSAKEIYLRPLRREDVFEFLTEAENRLHFRFDPKVKNEIVIGSMGYPYFVHSVGLECMDAMLARDRKARYVTEEDYNKAVARAVQQAFRSELRRYKDAVKDLSQHERTVIRELVSFGRQPPRKDLQEAVICKRLMSAAEFDHAWVRLQQEKRLLYISRTNDTIRFADPLMAPFLRAWIFRIPEKTGDEQPRLFDDDD